MMSPIAKYLIFTLVLSVALHAKELSQSSRAFIAATKSGNLDEMREIYFDSSIEERALKEFQGVIPLLKSGDISISVIDRELVIGRLGVTLMHIRDKQGSAYKPMIMVNVEGQWRLFPWSKQSDLKILEDNCTPDERIHLKLFNKWANLVEQDIKSELSNKRK